MGVLILDNRTVKEGVQRIVWKLKVQLIMGGSGFEKTDSRILKKMATSSPVDYFYGIGNYNCGDLGIHNEKKGPCFQGTNSVKVAFWV